jgi:hypothetical protein
MAGLDVSMPRTFLMLRGVSHELPRSPLTDAGTGATR